MGFFDNIFPLIVIYIIWQIFSKVQKSIPKSEDMDGQGASTENEPGQVKVNIRDVLQQILSGGEVDLPHVSSAPLAEQSWAPSQNIAEQTSLVPEQHDDIVRDLVAGKKKSVEVVEQSLSEKQSRSSLVMSRKKLQQAVLWSEILAKPMALREQRDGF